MTSKNIGNQRALHRLAKQACSATESTSAGNGSTGGRKKIGKATLLTGMALTASLGWAAYSQWTQRSSTEERAVSDSAGALQSGAASALANSAWTSSHDATADSPDSASATSQEATAVAVRPLNLARNSKLEERVEPIESLVRKGDPKAVTAVVNALADDDAQVRSRVMDAAINAYVAIPESTLIEHAQSDPSPDVRFLALSGIAARIDPALPQVGAIDPSTARAIAAAALNDTSEQVRWQAQQLLDSLNTAEAAPANDQAQVEAL